MKIFKNIVLVLLLLITLFLVGVYAYLMHLKPSYKGTVHVNGVANTEVYFDSIGVPHIFSDSEKDAMTALGYVHAQERLWQMELLRRIASGRLAEIFGKDLLEVDTFFSSLGIDASVNKQVASLEKNPKVKALVAAYLKGVNSYIENGVTPIEFTLLGITKEKYTVKDTYYVSAYMAFNFADAFKTDPILSTIKSKLGKEYLKDLALDVDENSVYQENYDVRKSGVKSVSAVLEKLPFPQFIGSNAWVLSPKKTSTGKVLLENDPHIGFSQPSVWYQAHIKTPTYENYGFYLGLFPFPMLAHNRDYAFGITMFENDDIDFYQFKQHPTDSTKYSTASGEYTYEYIQKKINIKGEETKNITLKKTVLGMVFNERLDSIPTAVQWVCNEKPNQVLQMAYELNHANGILDFEKHLESLTAPGLNFVYGDKNDNIGLWSAGKLYQRNKGVNGMFVLDGMDSIQTKKEWLPFTKNPKNINPPKGYLFTSNIQPAPIDGELYPGYYLSKDRAVAIKKVLEAKEKLSVSDMKSLATSHTNTTVLKNITAMVYGLDIEQLTDYELMVLDRLLKWRGNHHVDNIEPAIYYKLNFKLLKNTFKDELGKEGFNDFVNTHLCKRTQNKYLKSQNSIWWDDVNTPEKETFTDVVTRSFKTSVAELRIQLGDNVDEWKWCKVHQVTHEHALAKVDLLKKYLNVGAFPMVGGNETINNQMFDYTEDGIYKITKGPSTRRVIDFSDIENSFAVIPTGQSGNFLSPFYDNQAAYYNAGKYFKMLLNEEEIKQSDLCLVFE